MHSLLGFEVLRQYFFNGEGVATSNLRNTPPGVQKLPLSLLSVIEASLSKYVSEVITEHYLL